MDPSSLRVRYHLVNAGIVALVLVAYQYWRTEVDWVFIVAVAVLYLAVSLAIDLVRNRDADS